MLLCNWKSSTSHMLKISLPYHHPRFFLLVTHLDSTWSSERCESPRGNNVSQGPLNEWFFWKPTIRGVVFHTILSYSWSLSHVKLERLLLFPPANMSFDLDVQLDEYSIPAGKERAATYTGQYSPSRMGMTIIPSFDSTEVSSCQACTERTICNRRVKDFPLNLQRSS